MKLRVPTAVLLLLGQISAAHISQKLRANIATNRDKLNYDNVQLNDHFNDSDDIPAGLEPAPAGLAQRGVARQRMDQDDAVRAYYATSHVDPEEDDRLFVEMPHEEDTDDLAVALNPDGYDHHHSKRWNMLVEQRASEMEQEMAITENLDKAQKKAAADAQRKAALARADKLKKRQEAKRGEYPAQKPFQTIDLGQLYGPMAATNVMVDDDIKFYEHHSPYWEELTEDRTQQLARLMREDEEDEQQPRKRTVDFNELYDDITVQTGYRPMTDEMEARAEQLAAAMRADEEEQATEIDQKVLERSDGVMIQSVQKNTSNDLEEMYKDLALNKDLVQLRDHENDSDDVVAEFSEPVNLAAKNVEHKVPKPVDFAGATYEETYDD